MKNLILAAIATLSLGVGMANTQTLTRSAPVQPHSQQSDPNTIFVPGGDGAAG